MSLRCLLLAFAVSTAVANAPAPAEEVYGPQDLLKTMKTPFGAPVQEKQKAVDPLAIITPVAIRPNSIPRRRSLSERLVASNKVYLPGRMYLGKPAEFTIKGEPGKWAAIAMSESNSGAKPVFGHNLRLGPDRKLVAVTQIPSTGVASLFVPTPIQGDLVGQYLYFEAAVWGNPDCSDAELAASVSDGESRDPNAVLIAAQQEPVRDKGLRFVPDSGGMPSQKQSVGIDSGRP